jgi:hypothetical protein
MKLEDAIIPLGIGALIGVGLNMMKGNNISMAADADTAPVEAQPINAEGEVDITLGQEPASEGYNTSEVWDFRDRVYNNDNVLYNKLPFIDLSPTTEWNPENLRLIGSRDYDCVA